MNVKWTHVVCALALVVFCSGTHASAQDGGKTKDDTLDSLLKELNEPEKGAAKSDTKAGRDEPKAGLTRGKPGSGRSEAEPAKASTTKGDKPPIRKTPDAGKVAPKDQALDELLGKLGEAKDEPTPEEQPPGGGSGDDRRPPPRTAKPGADKLGGKDKDLDERLEELTGRKKKPPKSEQERTGPIGDMIKEMRDVEERLGKPDPSEATQKKQKQIVKRIETLIEQAKQSGSSGSRMVMRQVRQAGQQPGQESGDPSGAQGRGAPRMKPAKPTTQHSTAGGKDVWGHSPEELRQVMENSFKETELESKRELISRYFLSVGKGKTNHRGE